MGFSDTEKNINNVHTSLLGEWYVFNYDLIVVSAPMLMNPII